MKLFILNLNLLVSLSWQAAEPRPNIVLTSDNRGMLNQGGGGFRGTKTGDHSLGGPAALKFAGEVNSDVVNGKFKPRQHPWRNRW